MIAFEVNDMTCDHCVAAIRRAVNAVDRRATVDISLQNHKVEIDSGDADAAALARAIRVAGYTPSAVDGDQATAAAAPTRNGCCCG